MGLMVEPLGENTYATEKRVKEKHFLTKINWNKLNSVILFTLKQISQIESGTVEFMANEMR